MKKNILNTTLLVLTLILLACGGGESGGGINDDNNNQGKTASDLKLGFTSAGPKQCRHNYQISNSGNRSLRVFIVSSDYNSCSDWRFSTGFSDYIAEGRLSIFCDTGLCTALNNDYRWFSPAAGERPSNAFPYSTSKSLPRFVCGYIDIDNSGGFSSQDFLIEESLSIRFQEEGFISYGHTGGQFPSCQKQ